jgi:hypothetical protein
MEEKGGDLIGEAKPKSWSAPRIGPSANLRLISGLPRAAPPFVLKDRHLRYGIYILAIAIGIDACMS